MYRPKVFILVSVHAAKRRPPEMHRPKSSRKVNCACTEETPIRLRPNSQLGHGLHYSSSVPSGEQIRVARTSRGACPVRTMSGLLCTYKSWKRGGKALANKTDEVNSSGTLSGAKHRRKERWLCTFIAKCKWGATDRSPGVCDTNKMKQMDAGLPPLFLLAFLVVLRGPSSHC